LDWGLLKIMEGRGLVTRLDIFCARHLFEGYLFSEVTMKDGFSIFVLDKAIPTQALR